MAESRSETTALWSGQLRRHVADEAAAGVVLRLDLDGDLLEVGAQPDERLQVVALQDRQGTAGGVIPEMRDCGGSERLLAVEMVIKRTLRHACGVGDVLHARAVEADPAEHGYASLQQAIANGWNLPAHGREMTGRLGMSRNPVRGQWVSFSDRLTAGMQQARPGSAQTRQGRAAPGPA